MKHLRLGPGVCIYLVTFWSVSRSSLSKLKGGWGLVWGGEVRVSVITVTCDTCRDSDAGGQDKYKLKWAVPVKEVEVVGGAVKSHYLVQSRHGWTVSTPLDSSTCVLSVSGACVLWPCVLCMSTRYACTCAYVYV